MKKYTKFQPIEPLVPERFREARLSRGLTAGELAEKVGVSRQSIYKYEIGTAEPSASTMESISQHLNMPIPFFHKPVSAPENMGTVFFRSYKTRAARAKEIMLTKSQWAAQIAGTLAKDIIFPPPDLPTLPDNLISDQEFSLDEIDDIAMHVRKHWGLGTGPISNVSKLLESRGIIIATIKTGFRETDACSSFVNARPFIFLDTQKECAVRRRFDMAHELGHMILHGGVFQEDIERKDELERIEREANQFAACFLLPRSSFLADIRSTSLQYFVPLKKKWKVSIQAMVYRCRELGVFSDSQMVYIQKQISASRWKKNEPFDDEWPCEETAVLGTAVKMLIERGDYTKEEFVALFRLPESDLEELCSLPTGFLSDTPLTNNSGVVIDFSTRKIIRS